MENVDIDGFCFFLLLLRTDGTKKLSDVLDHGVDREADRPAGQEPTPGCPSPTRP
jgi:hypothetical protein